MTLCFGDFGNGAYTQIEDASTLSSKFEQHL